MLSGLEVIQVIRTHLQTCGSGKDESNPIRVITQYWSMEGELLWQVDPYLQMMESSRRPDEVEA